MKTTVLLYLVKKRIPPQVLDDWFKKSHHARFHPSDLLYTFRISIFLNVLATGLTIFAGLVAITNQTIDKSRCFELMFSAILFYCISFGFYSSVDKNEMRSFKIFMREYLTFMAICNFFYRGSPATYRDSALAVFRMNERSLISLGSGRLSETAFSDIRLFAKENVLGELRKVGPYLGEPHLEVRLGEILSILRRFGVE